QSQWTDERYLHAPAGVERAARVLVCSECLSIEADSCCRVRLKAEDREGCLQKGIAAAGREGGGGGLRIVGCVGVLELEPHNQQTESKRTAGHRAVVGREVCPDKPCDIRARGCRGQKQ